MRVDVERLDRSIAEVGRRIDRNLERLKEDPTFTGTWKRMYGANANLGSREQLGNVLVELGHELPETPSSSEKKRRWRTDEAVLQRIDSDFTRRLLKVEGLKKLHSTYLKGLKGEVVDGFVHGVINLHTVETYRSSMDSPNLQNQPIREVEVGEIIRRCFVPRPGRRLVEIDYGALEFCIAAAIWKDPALVEYASNPKLDIHRDMAAECYCLDVADVSKEARFYAKNQFVFPILYGSWHKQCARNLWEAMEKHDLKTKSGKPIREVLASKGITKLGKCEFKKDAVPGTYEHHVKEVEARFMRRFPKFAKDKDTLYEQYRKVAGFDMPTGFRCEGLFTKNFLLNARVQGSAFHCLLWSLIETIKELEDRELKALVICEIHDCLLLDVPDEELQEVLDVVEWIMTRKIRKAWPWLIVPLKAEVDVTEVAEAGGNWFEKRPWSKVDGIWQPKKAA